MSTIASAVIDTGSNRIIHRNFIIQEAYEPGKDNVWEWAHEDFDRVTFPVSGSCQTIFECIDAITNWHDNAAEAAWCDQQERLMESGGPDNSTYRRQLVEAGRGHLLGDR